MLKKIVIVICLYSLTTVDARTSDLPDCNSEPGSRINWSKCNKSNINLNNQNLQLSDFSSTNFENTSFVNTNLSGSILTGANIKEVDFSNTKLDDAMWIDGRLCSTLRPKCQNRAPLNMGYALLKELLDQENIPEPLKQYYRKMLKSSISYNIEKFTFSYEIAVNIFSSVKDQNEDPITFKQFNDKDQVIILKTKSGKKHVFLKDSFLEWINTPSCKFSNPLTNEPIEFLMNI